MYLFILEDSSDFSWFGLSPTMTYLLIIIIAFVLLVGVLLAIVLLVRKANNEGRKEDIDDLTRKASNTKQKKK
ncbi:MAG: hypothetical protein K5762_07150 [Bacilli bacterium]|nr:hypothetical protein [Bacilli bacterium]